ncbi:unnamed protein product [Pseudo-nitzschia multistriata]|uniref:Uncharacterized protein n=1 Tax=Pseudo-nitzschia multistriata TaxID=183589 RepID=A0A448Z6R7_9STRA|nr:unnamed protein product [Pseudo-nitzschia multistriata]
MWDDLFRAAAGEDDIAEPMVPTRLEAQRNPRKHEASTSAERNPKRKKKRARHRNRGKSSQSALERVLESRTDPIGEQIWSRLPAWLVPGSSLRGSAYCGQWDQEADCSLDAKCKKCKETLLHHSVELSSSTEQTSAGEVLTAFSLVRDIRCCCSCILNESYGCNDQNKCIKSELDVFAITALKKSDHLDIVVSSVLDPGEADILIGKIDNIKNAAIKLSKKMKHWNVGSQIKNSKFKLRGIFNEVIKLIIHCDAAYFRLYYLQNSGNLPIEKEEVYIPHPPTYFGSKNVAWNVFDSTTGLADTMRKKYGQISDERWDILMQELGISRSSQELDPLSFMHKNRLSESIFIFHNSSWIHSKETKLHYTESMKQRSKFLDRESAFYSIHETPAPDIVKEWRDSCRDLLCNLYAYATISPRMIYDTKGVLRKEAFACKSLIEMGAGTGYIANLFVKADFSVKAFDVAPTNGDNVQNRNSDVSNEYHGSSPPFCRVEYADSKSLRLDTKDTALLLSYPPPLSTMAEDSLKSFVKQGGRIIIHVGEFSGLTGSSKFESFLGRRFDLKYRTPCLNWGSDAAELTIWIKCDTEKKSFPSSLVRCSWCKKPSATARYRLCRPLSYCQYSCFRAHQEERGVHFAFTMIPDAINANDLTPPGAFERKPYFESLPCKCDF